MDWSGKIPAGRVLVECDDCGCFHHIPEKEFDELPGDYYICDDCAEKSVRAPYSIHDFEFQEEIAACVGWGEESNDYLEDDISELGNDESNDYLEDVIEPNPVELGERESDQELIIDTIVDLINKTGQCNGVFENCELEYFKSFKVTLPNGYSYIVTVEDDL